MNDKALYNRCGIGVNLISTVPLVGFFAFFCCFCFSFFWFVFLPYALHMVSDDFGFESQLSRKKTKRFN